MDGTIKLFLVFLFISKFPSLWTPFIVETYHKEDWKTNMVTYRQLKYMRFSESLKLYHVFCTTLASSFPPFLHFVKLRSCTLICYSKMFHLVPPQSSLHLLRCPKDADIQKPFCVPNYLAYIWQAFQRFPKYLKLDF